MTVTAWVLSILGLVLVGTLVELLLTKSRLKNYIRSVFATVTVLVALTPLPTLISGGVSGGTFDFDSVFKLDENYLEIAADKKLELVGTAVEKALADDGIEGAEVKVHGTVLGGKIEIDGVSVNLSNSVIADKYQHINRNDLVKGRTAKYLNVSEDKITVYE